MFSITFSPTLNPFSHEYQSSVATTSKRPQYCLAKIVAALCNGAFSISSLSFSCSRQILFERRYVAHGGRRRKRPHHDGYRIPNTPENIQKAVSSIIHTRPGVADGVSFSDKLNVQEITKDALYVGLRISFSADVAGVCCDMKVDIGFSDEVYPAALMLDYPTTISGIPAAHIQCYSLESVIAEKWQAMVQLKQMNSRMKDFYDLWFLSRRYSFAYDTLKEAISRTFDRRATHVNEYTALKTDNYQKAQQAEWAAYIRKMKAATFQKKNDVEIPSRIFADVIDEILSWLEPVMNDAQYHTWKPGIGWR